jgi:hypothetical protein
MEVEENPITERWGGGLDRIERLAAMKSNGKNIFRQEQKTKEGEEGDSVLSRVWGLYQVSMPGYSYLWNRDINAAINIANIYLHLLEYDVEPWEFRHGVELMKMPEYIPEKSGSLAIDH